MITEERFGRTSAGVRIGDISGDVLNSVFAGRDVTIVSRSSLEECTDFLARAVAAFEALTYQSVSGSSSPPSEPYKFLCPYEVEDSKLFFGREAAAQDLYERILSARVTVVHAKSGAGKTSLLNAGVSPRLIHDNCLPVYARAYRDPVLAIKQAIAAIEPWPEMLPRLTLHAFLRLVCERLSRTTRELVVILDQFEEFFNSPFPDDYRVAFGDDLGRCIHDRSLPLRFVISLRKESFAELAAFSECIPTIFHNQYALERMTRDEAVAAVVGPVSRLDHRVDYEPALLAELLDDLRQGGMELPHLQIICTCLYKTVTKDKTTITLADYDALGGAEGILGTYLYDVLKQFPGVEERIAREVLKELVSSKSTRRVLSFGDLAERIADAESELAGVLGRLVDARLLHRTEDTSVVAYEMAHEYLIEEIEGWLDAADLEFKRIQETLERELASWRVIEAPINRERLDSFREYGDRLSFEDDARVMLFASALEQGHDVAFWLSKLPAEDQEQAVEKVVSQMIAAPQSRQAIAADLWHSLDEHLRPSLLTALWSAYEGSHGDGRQNAAKAILAFGTDQNGSWKSRVGSFPAFIRWASLPKIARVTAGLLPALGPRTVAMAILAVLVLVGITGVIAFFTRDRRISGRWIEIPAGPFVMGYDEQQAAYASELCSQDARRGVRCWTPDDLLRLSARREGAELPTYQILENEVTNVQFEQCVDDGSCQPSDWIYNPEAYNLPVTGLTWNQAMTYCIWLGGRLPTEEEWERAARGTEGRYFPWGDSWDPNGPAMANLNFVDSEAPLTIRAYGRTDVTPEGIKNLAGNVSEWTASKYVFFPDVPFENDALPPETDDSVEIVLRGGYWSGARSDGMGSWRGVGLASEARAQVGFRCVCLAATECRTPWNMQWELSRD